jgi:hypothetical protein
MASVLHRLPEQKETHACGTDAGAEISPECRNTAQERLEIENNVTKGTLQVLRLSVRELCRMHFDLTW